jgi:hypothetical protein
MVGHPTALTQREPDKAIDVILQAFRERCPLTLPKIDAGIRVKFDKSIMPEKLS